MVEGFGEVEMLEFHPKVEREGAMAIYGRPFRELMNEYDERLLIMNEQIEKGEEFEKVEETDNKRRKIKSDIAENIAVAFEYENPKDSTFSFLTDLVQKITGEKLKKGETISEAVIRAYEYAEEIMENAAVSEKRAKLEPQEKIRYQKEFHRLKPIIRDYLEPQSLVKKHGKREPSIFEAIAASARLNELKEKVVQNLGDVTDSIIVAGSLNWGQFFDTRGTGTSRYFSVEHGFVKSDAREQFTVSYEDEKTRKIIRERKENELSDVDIVIVAKPNENISEIYQRVFKDQVDINAKTNLAIINKFAEMLNDPNIPLETRPVSINLDFGTKEGFRSQMIIFSNKGFKELYRTDINELENIYLKNKGEVPLYHEKQKVKIIDQTTGAEEEGTAEMLFHPNLDYKEGTLEEVKKKATKLGEYEQSLIGGKLIVNSYPTEPVGEPILVDREKGIYGQYMIKYYPFGGFAYEQGKSYGSYFLGFNPDNMILGKNFGKEDTETSQIASDYKLRYFKRISGEQKEKSNLSSQELANSHPEIIFGPYLSRWNRMPEHSREMLFDQFEQYLKAESLKPNVDYYFCSMPKPESVLLLQEAEGQLDKFFGKKINTIPKDDLHITEFYFPSLDKLNAFFKEAGFSKELTLDSYRRAIEQSSIVEARPRVFSIKGAELFEKSIALEFEGKDEINKKIGGYLMQSLEQAGFSGEEIKKLFEAEDFSLKHHRHESFNPHTTIAIAEDPSTINNAMLKSSLKHMKGEKLIFGKLELKENI